MSTTTTTTIAEDPELEVQRLGKCALIIRILKNILRGRTFLLGVSISIAFAALLPDVGRRYGPLHPEISVTYVLVPIIFLLSGISLETRELVNIVKHKKLTLCIQIFNLVIIPTILYVVGSLLRLSFVNRRLIDGFILMGALPTTVNMCVVYTIKGGGAESDATVNAVFGNLFGVIYTPAVLFLVLGFESPIDMLNSLFDLSFTIILPFFIGQIFQRLLGDHIEFIFKFIGPISTGTLLFMIFTTYSDTFSPTTPDVDPASIGIVSVLTVGSYVLLLGLGRLFFAIQKFQFTRTQQVAALFCGTHKTIALGIPLINIFYGSNPDVGAISVPLLFYHTSQMLVGGFLMNRIQSWSRAETAASATTNGSGGDEESGGAPAKKSKPLNPAFIELEETSTSEITKHKQNAHD